MGKSYGEKLRDPRWQRMRLKVLERAQWACASCGDEKSTLHVHHMYYVSGRDPWQYPLSSLVALCEKCHEQEPQFGAWAFEEQFLLVEALGVGQFAEALLDLPMQATNRIPEGVRLAFYQANDAARVYGRAIEAITRGNVDSTALLAAFNELLVTRFGYTADVWREQLSRLQAESNTGGAPQGPT